jgi:hypothetical protein
VNTDMAILKIRRGNFSNLPALSDGEMAYIKDTNDLYIGHTGVGNVQLGNMRKAVYDTNNDGIVDLAEQALSLTPYNTSNTSNTDTNKWTKMADVVIDARYGETTIRFLMAYVGHSSGSFKKGTVDFRVNQAAALGSPPIYELSLNETDGIEAADIKAVLTENTITQSTVSLYIRIVDNYTEVTFIPLIRYAFDSELTIHETEPFTASLPAGTQVSCTYQDHIVQDSKYYIRNSADLTKKVQFDLSGITTATTRTFTLPNESGTLQLAGKCVLKTGDTMTGPLTLQGAGLTVPGADGIARIGSGSADGLILIGQGSVYDMVVTNKNGTSVLAVPTGTQNVYFLGRVGIGSVSPSFPLDIQTTIASARIRSTTGSNHAVLYINNNAGDFYIGRNDSVGTALIPTGGLSYSSVLNSQGTYPLQFAVNNAAVMTITSSGNVGIGTNAPTNTANYSTLEIMGKNPTTGGNLLLSSSDRSAQSIMAINNIRAVVGTVTNTPFVVVTNNTDRIAIEASGNVGIGTNLPAAILHVQKATAGSGTISGMFDNTDFTAGNRNFIRIRQAISGAASYSAYLGVDRDNYHVFLNNESTTGTHLTISPTGNVGIGCTPASSEYKLDIQNSSNGYVYARVRNLNATAGQSRYGVFAAEGDNGAVNCSMWAGKDVSNVGSGFIGTVTAHPLNVLVNATTRIFIDTAGNVGMGTSNPLASLEVKKTDGTATSIRITRPATASLQYRELYFDADEGTKSPRAFIRHYTNTADNTHRVDLDSSYGNLIGFANWCLVPQGGNVGIATTSPQAKLHILTPTASDIVRVRLENSASTGATSGAAYDIYTHNGTASVRVGALLGTSNSWSLGSYVTNQITLLGLGSGGLCLKTAVAPITFNTGTTGGDDSAERMRIDSNGNIGIGTTNPMTKLDVRGNIAIANNVLGGGKDYGNSGNANNATLTMYDPANGNTVLNNIGYGINLQTNGTARLFINNSGNVGIGTSSIKAWQSAYTALQLGGNAAIFSTKAVGASNSTYMTHNAYYDGSWKYISADKATQYAQYDGRHLFYSAATGAVDGTVTFSNTATIDGNGVSANGFSVGSRDISALSISTKTANYTITNNDDVIMVDASSGNITITLIAVASRTLGRPIHIKRIDSSANIVTIDGSGSETIDGDLSFTIDAQYDAYTLVPHSGSWYNL